MLSDDELLSLRQRFIDAAIATVPAGARSKTWDNLIFDPKSETIQAFIHGGGVPVDVQLGVIETALEIGYACAGQVLAGVPLELANVPDRRWQLQRELSQILKGMSLEQIQQLVYRARAIAQ